MHISWEYIETFLAVAEETSFSAAARRLEVTQPTISRRIVALEEKLGRTLFRRDVEGAHLNADGAKLLPLASQMARYAEEWHSVAENFEENVEGLARIAAPVPLTHTFIIPLARAAKEHLPELRVEVHDHVSEESIVRGEVELALLDRAPRDPELVVLTRCQVRTAAYGSRAYAQASRSADSVEYVGFPPSALHREPNKTLSQHGAPFRLAFSSPDLALQWQAMEAGLGAMVLPELFSEKSPLEKLKVPHEFPSREIFLVCSTSSLALPRVRTLADWIGAKLQEAAD